MQTCDHCQQSYDEQTFAGCPFCRAERPDAAPGAAVEAVAVRPGPGFSFRDQSRLTRTITGLVIVQVVVAVVSLGSSVLERRLLDAIAAGAFPSREALDTAAHLSDRREMIIGWVALALFVLCGLLVIDWLKTANRNARALGATDLPISPGWSAGWFFIPVANLWKPYQAVKHIWQASHQPQDWRSFPSTALLPLWWTLWLIGNGLGRVIMRMNPKTMAEVYRLNSLNLVSCGIDIVLCLLFFELVRQIHRAQMAEWARQQDLTFSFT